MMKWLKLMKNEHQSLRLISNYLCVVDNNLLLKTKVYVRIWYQYNSHRNEWVSDGCLMLNQQFVSCIVSRTICISMRRWWWWWWGLLCTRPTCLVLLSPCQKVAKGYSDASVCPSFRNILVNTLESTSFNGFRSNLVHI